MRWCRLLQLFFSSHDTSSSQEIEIIEVIHGRRMVALNNGMSSVYKLFKYLCTFELYVTKSQSARPLISP